MVHRVYVEKQGEFAVAAAAARGEIVARIGVDRLRGVRLLHRYEVEGISSREFLTACKTILSEAPLDRLFDEQPDTGADERILIIEALPGQFDQRADSAAQAIQLLTHGEQPLVRTAEVWIFSGEIAPHEFDKIRSYLINPVEAREGSQELVETLDHPAPEVDPVPRIDGFIAMDEGTCEQLRLDYGLAMSREDLLLCRDYFAAEEKRDPTESEIRVLDTYWSDHCRHTTFLTCLDTISFGSDPISKRIEQSYRDYLAVKERYSQHKPVSLMDLATIVMKQFRAEGRLDDLEVSEEINACSIRVEAEIDGTREPWLVMFKNETHNHPTEIEPFGGAATCLGGAIRDPLSGRSYVYQAMRVTGGADPREPVAATLPGKLPQRTICTVAARGYSSYGNQIGIATGQVHEFYHPGYKAKRMEIGAVVGAAPATAVVRREPEPGDLVLLVGGLTGRDGIGGATGSSREHSTDSLERSGAEVQKGNPPTERKLQRLFRDHELSRRIKRCNDFGAGGIAVAVGELAPGLEIDLDTIPRKYSGLNGTELAISESQERMALVVSTEDLNLFLRRAAEENLEATVIATVTAEARLVMHWRGEAVVDLSRSFLDTNGAEQRQAVRVDGEPYRTPPFALPLTTGTAGSRKQWIENLGRLESAGQEGLGQLFDSSIGAATLLAPFGGIHQTTPADGMAALLPVSNRQCDTATLMSFGFDPHISSWSPFHGGIYAVLQSAARISALGGDYRRIRLSLQEYFERLGKDPTRWGKPLSSLLGAFTAQEALGIPAVGGKDSMSGSFESLDVPPTLVAFAVAPVEAERIVSQELKRSDSVIWLLRVPTDSDAVPELKQATELYRRLFDLPATESPMSMKAVGAGGPAATICQMAFGNSIGVEIEAGIEPSLLFSLEYGSLLAEFPADTDCSSLFAGLPVMRLGRTMEEAAVRYREESFSLVEALAAWRAPLDPVFRRTDKGGTAGLRRKREVQPGNSPVRAASTRRQQGVAPRVLIPVFPGTNCEYDSAAAFEAAGARTTSLVIRNLNPRMVEESIAAVAKLLDQSQILMIPGGFSAGDEPEGSGKFIAAFFRNQLLARAVEKLLTRDGLILGICNGFQALIKLGLLPTGKIDTLTPESPTLTFNTLGAHVSRFVSTRIENTRSPWLSQCQAGEIHTIPVSHGEGRFVARAEVLERLESGGQIAARYCDADGNPTMEAPANPNGSVGAVEALTSPDGRILGKMGHSERCRPGLYRNIPGEKDQKIFRAGVDYFL